MSVLVVSVLVLSGQVVGLTTTSLRPIGLVVEVQFGDSGPMSAPVAGPTVPASRLAALVEGFHRSPAYAGLAEALQLLIGDGRIGVDVRLPSERDLTEALGVSRTTVTRAYARLRETGYAVARQGHGTRTRVPGGRLRAHDRALMPSSPGSTALDLTTTAPTAPPHIAPAYAAALEQLPPYLAGQGYFPLGVDELRELVAAHHERQGLPTSPDQVVVTTGALSALVVVTRALGAAGRRVVAESPTYPNAAAAIRSGGGRVAAAPVDPDGWDVDAVAGTARQTGALLAHLQPDFHNPTGHLMGDEDRARLAGLLAGCGTRAVVDETHRDVVLDPDLVGALPLPYAAHDPRAVTIGSISKSHWGGVRIGWVRAPRDLVPALLQARIALDLGAPVLEQLVAAQLLAAGDAVLTEQRRRWAAHRDHLIHELVEHLPAWQVRRPRGGLALWVDLPYAASTALCDAAARHGLSLAPGPVFSVGGGLDRHLRLPFTRERAELTDAVARLAVAWDELEQSGTPTRAGTTRGVTTPGTHRPGGASAPPGRVWIG